MGHPPVEPVILLLDVSHATTSEPAKFVVSAGEVKVAPVASVVYAEMASSGEDVFNPEKSMTVMPQEKFPARAEVKENE